LSELTDPWILFEKALDLFLKQETDIKFPELYGLVSNYVVGKELKSPGIKNIKSFKEYTIF